jgi:GNAT superfamily N-acetyltransferase
MSAALLRPYAFRDRSALEALADEVVRDGTTFPFEDTAGVAAYWFGRGSCVVVAEDGGDVVGSYTIKPNHPGRGAHVANAGYMVAESYRGRGLGRALGEHSLMTARALGYRALQFNQVVATNVSAVRLWERLGFAVIGRAPGAFRHPEVGWVDTLMMFRTL